MKRSISMLLIAIMCLSLFGCAGNTVTRDETVNGVSKVWSASDDSVTREVGGLAIDDGWGSIESNDSKAGSLVKVEYEVKPTVYTFVARMLAKAVNSSNTTPTAAMIVKDSKGNKLAEKVIRSCDFTATMTYKDFSLDFEVPARTKLSLEIYWPGYLYTRVSEFAIMSKKETSVPDYKVAPEAALGVGITEDIVYSDSDLYVFDMLAYQKTLANSEVKYDVANMLAILQGIVNRNGQHIFYKYMEGNKFSEDTDGFWLDYLTKDGKMLADKTVVEVLSPMTLLRLFKDKYNGFAVWDENVPATVNAAATACGVEDLLPLRYDSSKDSIYYYLLNGELEKTVKIDLAGKFTGKGVIYETNQKTTGSRKNDVYAWAKTKYLDSQKVNPFIIAYHVDAYSKNQSINDYVDLQNMFLMNKDYYIKNKCFFFDLSPMMFEIPNDDPDQVDMDLGEGKTLDYQSFVKIMTAQNKLAASKNAARPISVGGFTPWHLKYTRYTNPSASDDVMVEWETVFQFSIFNAYVNADAPSYTNMTNASIYEEFQLQDKYTQNCDRTKAETARLPLATEQGANYLLFHMGDYDASAWLNTAMIKMWNDPMRGKLPLQWPTSVGISDRAPHAMDMIMTTATPNDYIVCGDNGVGYLMPEGYTTTLRNGPEYEGLNGSMDAFANYSIEKMQQFDMDLLGFVVARKPWEDSWLEMVAKMSPKGFAVNIFSNKNMIGETSIIKSIDVPGGVNGTVTNLLKNVAEKKVGDDSSFLELRFILNTPTEVALVWDELQKPEYSKYNFKLVDPYSMYALHKQQFAK